MVGGLWDSFRERMVRGFRRAGINVEGPRSGLSGNNPNNICNRGQTGAGGQLELSEGLRRRLRSDPDDLIRFVEVVRGVLLEVEAMATTAGPRDR